MGVPVLAFFGRDLRALTGRARARSVARALAYWRRRGFPYPVLARRELEHEVRRLIDLDVRRVVRRRTAVALTTGLRLANSFHPQMWRIPEHGRSPVQVFEDDATLRRVLEKCIQFYPHRRCWNAQCVRSVLRVFHRTRVANFRPAVARMIYERYSDEGDAVFDFAAGFGGRMLGALCSTRRYVGVDPEAAQIRGCRRMGRAVEGLLPGTFELHRACAEGFMPTLPARTFDLVFGSPPYFDTERYADRPSQSFIRHPTYAEWKNGFLFRVLEEAHRILRPGGRLVLNLTNTNRLPIMTDTERFCRRHFLQRDALRLQMHALPAARASGASMYRHEWLLVFQKRVAVQMASRAGTAPNGRAPSAPHARVRSQTASAHGCGRG